MIRPTGPTEVDATTNAAAMNGAIASDALVTRRGIGRVDRRSVRPGASANVTITAAGTSVCTTVCGPNAATTANPVPIHQLTPASMRNSRGTTGSTPRRRSASLAVTSAAANRDRPSAALHAALADDANVSTAEAGASTATAR